ncbi:MAG: 16S rRNA (uracil1498-N3)-methyltransferase [Planctomycetota bacterium]
MSRSASPQNPEPNGEIPHMSSLRRFVLQATPIEGAPKLLPEDQEHALKVLRVRAGDRIVGLDGRGNSWELVVKNSDRRNLELELCGEMVSAPVPGSAKASLPWIEVWCPLPKGNRAEAMISKLTQLGMARFVPILSENCEIQAKEASKGRFQRLERSSREALKQCGRLWLPVIDDTRDLALLEQEEGNRIVLDPECKTNLGALIGELSGQVEWTGQNPLILIAGPEGGFSPRELALLRESGAHSARIGPHILRIESAVEAALAIVACATFR